ncbi:MAG: exodeoxyribonuclease I, partial [Methylomicrobium sp.]|nr:exodeoxyribonuclease I [Methylomicrobium sp.]
FRFRARNYPETLSNAEKDRWRKFCFEKLEQHKDSHRIGFDTYFKKIVKLSEDGRLDQRASEELTHYGLAKRDTLKE